MKTLLTGLVIFAGLGYAQQSGEAGPNPQPDSGESAKPTAVLRRLESVTWDPLRAQLTWLVSVWDLESTADEPRDMERYVIHLDSDVMEFKGEIRRFDAAGRDVHALMDMISNFAMQSTVWWGRGGQGQREGQPGSEPDGTNGTKDKNKGDGQEDKPKPQPNGKAVALLQLSAPPAKSVESATASRDPLH